MHFFWNSFTKIIGTKGIIVLFSSLFLVLLVNGENNLASGGACLPQSRGQEFIHSSMVFSGQVTDKEYVAGFPAVKLQFSVNEIFKGVSNGTVTVFTNECLVNCEDPTINFTKGKNYTIFASPYQNVLIVDSVCGYTKEINDGYDQRTDLIAITKMISSGHFSPREQLAKGYPPQDMFCSEGLELFFKSKDNSPVCVSSKTATKLLNRGWLNYH